MICVIDYKAGNSQSVLAALDYIGVSAKLGNTPDDLHAADGIILPGVGSAVETMQSLGELGLIDGIKAAVASGKPFFGICVGFQVLFDHSEEGDADCLGLLPGIVRHFPPEAGRVPQMGWNEARFTRDDPILEGAKSGYYYFVNSYFVEPSDPRDVLAVTDYGGEFCSMAARKNLYGTQFHAEKSAGAGHKLLRAFGGLCGGAVLC